MTNLNAVGGLNVFGFTSYIKTLVKVTVMGLIFPVRFIGAITVMS